MESDLVPTRRLVLPLALLAIVALGLLPTAATAAPGVGPTSLTFSQETVGKTSSPQTVSVVNPEPFGAQLLGVSVGGPNPGDFSIGAQNCGATILLQSEGCLVEIAFAPQAGGAREATLEIAIEGEPALTVPLSGTGQTKKLTVPGSTGFPTTSVGGATSEKVLLKNSSEAGVNVNEVTFEGADAAYFGTEGTNCAGFIGAGMSCELSVRFTPGAAGPRAALLRVGTDATPGAYLVELSGEGAAPEVVFEPSSYDFGLVEAHSGGPRANLTLRNVGSTSVQLSNLEITGPGANEFWIPGSGCWGLSLAPGSTCGIEVQFNANEEGSFAAAVSVKAGAVAFQAPLSARAERPQVVASPAPLAFDPTAIGSRQVKEVTLTNTGHLPVAFFIALVSGGDVATFHLIEETCTSKVFAGDPRIFEPGESCRAKIAFEPTETGPKHATVSIFGAGEGALQFTVEGTAVASQNGSGAASSGAAGVAAASAVASRGRVTLNLNSHPQATAGKVTIGRARCESTEPCTLRVGGLVSGRLATAAGLRPAIRGVAPSRLTLAPGTSAAIVTTLPRELGGDSLPTRLSVAVQWRTGAEHGGGRHSVLLAGAPRR